MALELLRRNRRLINTDPQRRCYNGCHFSTAMAWGPWESLGPVKPEKAEETLAFWKDLNAYAVKARGPEALTEFKLVLNPKEPS